MQNKTGAFPCIAAQTIRLCVILLHLTGESAYAAGLRLPSTPEAPPFFARATAAAPGSLPIHLSIRE